MTASSRFITANVWYLITEHPTQPIWSSRGLSSTEPPRTKSEDRISLARPKSAVGTKRNDPDFAFLQSSITQGLPALNGPRSPLSSLTKPQEKLQSLDEAIYAQQASSPISPLEQEERERARRKRTERYDGQRASLRHSKSIPYLHRSITNDSQSNQSETDFGTKPRRRLTSRKHPSAGHKWQRAVLSIELWGPAGLDGARVKLSNADTTILEQPLPNERWRSNGMIGCWTSNDIYDVHNSIFGIKHVISTPFDPPAVELATDAVGDRAPPSGSNTPSASALFNRRRRGKTVTATSLSSQSADLARLVLSGPLPPIPQAGESEATDSAPTERSTPRRLFLHFSSHEEFQEWLVLLKTLARPQQEPRMHRRLHLTIWDVQDDTRGPFVDLGRKASTLQEDVLSENQSVKANSSVSQKHSGRHVPLPSDWATREKVAL